MSYPEYKVNTELQGSVSNKAMRKMKEERLCELRNALENGEKAVVTKKFFVSLPTAEAHHQCHPTGREVAMAQRVHPKIVDKIHELVLEGVIDPLEVQRHLKHCSSLSVQRTTSRCSRSSISSWTSGHTKSHQQSKTKHTVICTRPGKCGNEGWAMETRITYSKLFLQAIPPRLKWIWFWSARTKPTMGSPRMWQQDLLLRYGNTITMIDATYKTTKYDLPLFFVCVKTNHGYCVVAEFISQNECATTIQEDVWLQWGRDCCHWNIIPRHSVYICDSLLLDVFSL